LVKSSDIVACTNLHKLIETYKVQGGPSPAEVKRALDARLKIIAKNKKVIEKLKDAMAATENTLNSIIMGCSLYSQETVKLKNLDWMVK